MSLRMVKAPSEAFGCGFSILRMKDAWFGDKPAFFNVFCRRETHTDFLHPVSRRLHGRR
jgi:hypothetical protein